METKIAIVRFRYTDDEDDEIDERVQYKLDHDRFLEISRWEQQGYVIRANMFGAKVIFDRQNLSPICCISGYERSSTKYVIYTHRMEHPAADLMEVKDYLQKLGSVKQIDIEKAAQIKPL